MSTFLFVVNVNQTCFRYPKNNKISLAVAASRSVRPGRLCLAHTRRACNPHSGALRASARRAVRMYASLARRAARPCCWRGASVCVRKSAAAAQSRHEDEETPVRAAADQSDAAGRTHVLCREGGAAAPALARGCHISATGPSAAAARRRLCTAARLPCTRSYLRRGDAPRPRSARLGCPVALGNGERCLRNCCRRSRPDR